MRVLCVAEKPSMAKSITQILSHGSYTNRPGKDKYCRNFDFLYRIPSRFVPSNATTSSTVNVEMTFTSVRGHMTELEFPDDFRWGKCSPSALFTAPLLKRTAKARVDNSLTKCRNPKALHEISLSKLEARICS